MLFKLIKIRMTRLFYSMGNSGKKKGLKNKSNASAVVAYACLSILAVWFFVQMLVIYGIMYPMLENAGAKDFYFLLSMVLALTVAFIFNVFGAYNQLFSSNDNEMLFSLPIKPITVLLSRVISMWIMHISIVAVFMLPSECVHIYMSGFNAWQFISFLISMIMVSLVSLTVATLIGWIIGVLTKNFRHKNILIILLSLAGVALYFAAITMSDDGYKQLFEQFASMAVEMANAGKGILILGLCASAAAGDPLGLLTLIGIGVIPFALTMLIVSKSFVKIALWKPSGKLKKFSGDYKGRSIDKTLLSRELSHFASSPAYIINCSFGAFSAVAAAVLTIINYDSAAEFISQVGQLGEMIIAVVLCFLASLNSLSAASISIEGKKYLWQLKCLPIDPRKILKSKLMLHIVISAPVSLIVSLAAVMVFRPSVLSAIAFFVLPLGFMVISAQLGLIINLRFPNLDWISETQAVKQGVSLILSLLAELATVAVFAVITVLFTVIGLDPRAALILLAVPMMLMIWLLQKVTNKKGAEMFSAL